MFAASPGACLLEAVWAAVVRALPWCQEVNGSIVTRQQRERCLGPAAFRAWRAHPAATSKQHVLFVPVGRHSDLRERASGELAVCPPREGKPPLRKGVG